MKDPSRRQPNAKCVVVKVTIFNKDIKTSLSFSDANVKTPDFGDPIPKSTIVWDPYPHLYGRYLPTCISCTLNLLRHKQIMAKGPGTRGSRVFRLVWAQDFFRDACCYDGNATTNLRLCHCQYSPLFTSDCALQTFKEVLGSKVTWISVDCGAWEDIVSRASRIFLYFRWGKKKRK